MLTQDVAPGSMLALQHGGLQIVVPHHACLAFSLSLSCIALLVVVLFALPIKAVMALIITAFAAIFFVSLIVRHRTAS